MNARHSAGPAVAYATNGARRRIDQLGGTVNFVATPDCNRPQAIRAELIGPNICKTLGITAIGSAPVLSFCRKLLAAGVNPDRPMLVFRGSTLALRVRSIGEGAGLRVRGDGHGFEREERRPAAPLVANPANRLDREWMLNARELNFVGKLSRYPSQPTEKQLAWLHNIFRRLEAAA
jgi:hypothetical protein